MRADGFAVLRTPLLPVDELLRLSEQPDDREAVAAGVARLLARADVRDAIALASPSLAAALEAAGDPLPPKLLRAGYRYLARMCTRPTPFGLFAGTSLASLGHQTALALGPRELQRRWTTIDPQVLTALAESLARDAQVRSALPHRVNSSLYRAAGSARYARARNDGGRRSYELAAAGLNPAVEALIERARGGATPAQLAQLLVDGGADPTAAAGFVDQVIDQQILVADIVPPVTGADPLSAVIARLADLAPGPAATLAAAAAELERIDTGGVGAAAGGYGAVTDVLRELPGDADPARSLIADLTRPLTAGEVGRDVIAEIRRATDVLARMTPAPGPQNPLSQWRAAFENRYGSSEVPLTEALDEELGLGFQASTSPSADASPLLRGLPWTPSVAEPAASGRSRRLLALIDRARAAGSSEVELTSEDIAALSVRTPATLPDALSAMVTIASGGRVLVHGVSGPSGARLLGRICHADPDVAAAVREHLRREEALRPDAVYAEVVHLPEGSTGKLIARPLLREHEVEFLGRSGAHEDAVIALDDLLVSVHGDRIVLRSRRLGREVVPRLTSAHNYGRPGSLGVYRFLGALQAQGRAGGVVWSWGPLDGAPFLPRVRHGRAILARARWTLASGDLRALADATTDAARLDAAAQLRGERALPRWIAVADADNELVVDLENVVALDALARLAASRPELSLVEVWPEPEGLCVSGEDGSYAHELVIPFITAQSPAQRTAPAGAADALGAPAPGAPAPAALRAPGALRAPAPARAFLPGSEWLYAKLYAGTASADALLRGLVAPLMANALGSGAADSWFFIRFSDPDWHLRVRLHGDPARLATEVLPALHAAAERERAAGRLWRLELGTYEREIERYGGAIEACEAIFHADSDAVLAIMAAGPSHDERWQLALAGIAMLLADVLSDRQQRRALARIMRDAYAREHDAGKALFKAIGERWRRDGAALRALLAGEPAATPALRAGIEALHERSRRHAPAVARLRELEQRGELSAPLVDVAGSLVHMHANRLTRSAGRAHELVLLDLLTRVYAAEDAAR